MFLFCFFCSSNRPLITQDETVKERLRRLYKDHKNYTYRESHYLMYLDADCNDDQIRLIYDTKTYSWKCHAADLPPQTVTNTEHIVPQGFFRSQYPMVSDLHHIFSAPAKANNVRGNLPFNEFNYSQCKLWCKDMSCTPLSAIPSNADEYDCISKDKKSWMPRVADRGMIARAVLYFMTMYNCVDISKVGSLALFKKWNTLYPPIDFEVSRNNKLNASQGNRNPYTDDPSLVDQAFP